MKNTTIFLLFAASLAGTVQAQTVTPAESRRYIEVTGSAEMMVQPDEIGLEIILMEYYTNGEEGGKKVEIEKIEEKFYDVLKKNNIDIKNLSLQNQQNDNYWWYWWNYRHETRFRKTINIKLKKETNFLDLVEDLNQEWVASIRIVSKTNKDIYKFRQDVKVEAVKAAKEKATYMLVALGAQLGPVISVEELPEQTASDYYWIRQEPSMSNTAITTHHDVNGSDELENISGIKLRYEVKIRFEIQ